MTSIARNVDAATPKTARWKLATLQGASLMMIALGGLTAVAQTGEFRASDAHDFTHASPIAPSTHGEPTQPGDLWSW